MLRLGASPRFSAGLFYARADLGFAIGIPTGADVGEGLPKREVESSYLVHANVGVGVKVPLVQVSAELVNVGNVKSSDDIDFDERFEHTFALGLHFKVPVVQPYLAFIVPLDSDYRGEHWIVTVGANASFL